jgi:hypothetical protein
MTASLPCVLDVLDRADERVHLLRAAALAAPEHSLAALAEAVDEHLAHRELATSNGGSAPYAFSWKRPATEPDRSKRQTGIGAWLGRHAKPQRHSAVALCASACVGGLIFWLLGMTAFIIAAVQQEPLSGHCFHFVLSSGAFAVTMLLLKTPFFQRCLKRSG